MHLAGDGFDLTRENALTLKDWRPLFERSHARADEVQNGSEYRSSWQNSIILKPTGRHDLPKGIIHADLFTDNVFFLQGPSCPASSTSILPAMTCSGL